MVNENETGYNEQENNRESNNEIYEEYFEKKDKKDKKEIDDMLLLKNRKGWILLEAIMKMMYGIFLCISFFGIIFGIVLIVESIFLFQTNSNLVQGREYNTNACSALGNYFLFKGIITIIGIVFGFFSLIVVILSLLSGGGILESFLDGLGY